MELKDLYSIYQAHPSVQTDTRKLKPGDIFFALRGPNFNGNQFIETALEAGASFVVAEENTGINSDKIWIIDDALQTLQQLASLHRDRFTIPFIAITGSNGKTTTKELLHAVLSKKYCTYTTEGNLNNHIGVPLTLLKIKKDAEIAVIEMGANHQGEIASYCEYAKPNYGLITNIGKAHLEGFGGEAGVKKGKGELFEYLKNRDGTAFVNTDDPNVLDIAETVSKKILYGSKSPNHKWEILSSDPFLKVTEQTLSLSTNLVGIYNLPNILAAVNVGRYFNVPDADIASALDNYHPSNSRSQLIQRGTNTIIMDAYNANPGSMKAAIENFAGMKGNDKILILGDMKELGVDAEKEHLAIINLIDRFKWKCVALTGDIFSSLPHAYLSFKTSSETARWFREQRFTDSKILVKGSRSTQMEKVLE